MIDDKINQEDLDMAVSAKKIIGLTSASYDFEFVYKLYKEWIDNILHPDPKSNRKYFVARMGWKALPEELIEKEIRLLEFNLKNLTKFQVNLKSNGTMVNPEVIVMPPFGVYYIEKEGSYARIGQYCEELYKMFENKGNNFTTLAIFEEQEYRPKRSHIKVGVLSAKGMKVKDEHKDVVKYLEFNPFSNNIFEKLDLKAWQKILLFKLVN